MDFQVDALGPCRKKVTVTVPPDQVREEFERQYEEINDNVVLPGFRKGHAPRKILEKRFATHLGQEVKEKLVKSALEKLVEDKKVEPLRAPDIDLEKVEVDPAKPLEFSFELVTRPEFETPEWKGMEIRVPTIEVSDEDVDRAVEALRSRSARLEPLADGTIQDEDVVVVHWQALSGDSVEAHDDNAWYMVGHGVLGGFVVKGLDEELRGKGKGATAKVQVRAAEDDAREELRGKDLELEVEVKEVRRRVLPDVDEAFLKRHDFDDVDEMRAELQKQIRRARLRERDRAAEDQIVERLVEGVEMSLPEDFVKQELAQWARRRRTALQVEELSEDDITKTLDAERADAQENVEKDLRQYFVLDRIGDAEDVKVAESDLLQAIQGIARTYGRPEEEVLSAFRDPSRLSELSAQIRHRKIREVLLRAATVIEVAPQEADGAAPEPKAKAKKGGGKAKAKPADEAPVEGE